jgi:adenylate kinase
VSKDFTSFLNVAVGGPQATGKSSVLRIVSQQCPEFEVIFFGEQLPVDFLALAPSEIERIRAEVARRIASKLARRDSVKIVDLHYLDLREPNPKIQPADFLSCFDLLVFLTAPPEVLLERRMADTTRNDRPMTLADVRRDVKAHLEYHDELVNVGMNAALMDCQAQPLDVVTELLRRIDSAMRPCSLTSDSPNKYK